MADNKQNTDGRDDARVDSKDPSEVERVHQKFPTLSHQQIKDAIEKAGPLRKDIYEYIQKNHS